MKRCKLCKELKVREVNGIAISKFCSACKKFKELEKKEKHKQTKTYKEKEFKRLHNKQSGWQTFYISITTLKLKYPLLLNL